MGNERQSRGYRLEGRVLTGEADVLLEASTIVTEGRLIAWVGPTAMLPAQYDNPEFERVALPGRTIMPGLIDAHTHISFGEARSEEELALYTPVEFRSMRAVWNARKILQAGVTSAFDAATTYNIAASVRDAIDCGMFEGPRFAVSGRQLTSHQGLEDAFPANLGFPPGQAGVLVKSRDEIVENIRLQVKEGVDAIKVSGSDDALVCADHIDGSAFSFEEYRLIAEEAHRLDRMCTVHARTRDSAAMAARAGFDVIFHASHIDDEGIEWCLRNQCVIVPTLPLLANMLEATGGPEASRINAILNEEVEAASKNLSRAYRAGVTFAQGSESGWSPIPYGHWHAREMELFVKLLGLSPTEAIHCGTLAAARLFRRFGSQIGKLEAGRLADILVVNGKPDRDITLMQDPGKFDRILKDGKCVDRTPGSPRSMLPYERHKMYLNGLYTYDARTGRGVLQK